MKVPAPRLLICLLLVLPCLRIAAQDPGLPPRIVVPTEKEATRLAGKNSHLVMGTGSMQPYIPEHSDPNKIVAVLVTEKTPYEELKKGDLVIYRSEKNDLVVHQLATEEGDKWISSGLDNSFYDGPAVDRESYQSRVVRVYVIESAIEDKEKEKDYVEKAAEKKKEASDAEESAAFPATVATSASGG